MKLEAAPGTRRCALCYTDSLHSTAMAAPSALSITQPGVYPKLSTLPIIDISPYLGTDNHSKRISTSAALHAACLEYGFFYLDISKYVDPGEPEELTKLAREFFGLPEEEKDKIALRNQDGARGKLGSLCLCAMI